MRAFTLIELLVTVAILAILASLAITNVELYRWKVDRLEFISLSRQAIVAGISGLADGKIGQVFVNRLNGTFGFLVEEGQVQGKDVFTGPDDYKILFPGLSLPSYMVFEGRISASSNTYMIPPLSVTIGSCKVNDKDGHYLFANFNDRSLMYLGRYVSTTSDWMQGC